MSCCAAPPPFDSKRLRSAAYGEIQRIIKEDEPPRPSIRLFALGPMSTEVASARRVERDTLHRALRRELEWVPLMAMRKDRNQRYETPADLSSDIRNYLTQQPLSAAPESAAYRTRKLIIRNKGRVVTLGSVLLALLLGLVGTSIAATAAKQHAKRAEEMADAARLAQAESAARADQLQHSNQRLELQAQQTRDSLARLIRFLHPELPELGMIREPIALFRAEDGTVMRLWYRILSSPKGTQHVNTEECPARDDDLAGSRYLGLHKCIPTPEPAFESAPEAALARLQWELEYARDERKAAQKQR